MEGILHMQYMRVDYISKVAFYVDSSPRIHTLFTTSGQRATHCHGDEEEDVDEGDVISDVTGKTRGLKMKSKYVQCCVRPHTQY